jgi:gamma-glutamylcyclotransferase (GGCT)/AIG2-like uncharacterized protein YtfP
VPAIFSYGSLQQEAVQISAYGRVVQGEPDALLDCVLTLIEVPKLHKAASSGLTHYKNVESSPGSGSRVSGTVFEISAQELAVTDAYEQESDYVRVGAVLASGRSAWVYVSAGTAGDFEAAATEVPTRK